MKIKLFLIKSSISRNHGLSAKLDGELYGDPVESVGVIGKNCQYSIPCFSSFFIHYLAPLPKVPHTSPPGIHEGCMSMPNDFFLRTFCLDIGFNYILIIYN